MNKKLVVLLCLLFTLPNLIHAETLDHWLNRLEQGESGRRTQIKILDVNNKYSYGCLQFQRKTLENYAIKYGFRSEINEEDLFNCNLQKRVAMAMILDNWSNWRHWANVSLAIGLPPISPKLANRF